MEGAPTSVQAQLRLYEASACQLYAKFSGAEPDDWEVCHSESCMYSLENGALKLKFRMRIHKPGGNEVSEVTAGFDPVDNGTALVWRDHGIRLERVQPSGN